MATNWDFQSKITKLKSVILHTIKEKKLWRNAYFQSVCMVMKERFNFFLFNLKLKCHS